MVVAHTIPFTVNPIERTFAGTTVDNQAVREYLHEDPGLLQICISLNSDAHMRSVANHADYFAFHLKRYLLGGAKTLHRVMYEARAFRAVDEPKAHILCILIMKDHKEKLLQNEWYEIMPRFEHARTLVKQMFLQ